MKEQQWWLFGAGKDHSDDLVFKITLLHLKSDGGFSLVVVFECDGVSGGGVECDGRGDDG